MTYGKAVGASGYEISWSRKLASGYTKKPKTTRNLSLTLSGLISGKNDYVRVRPYRPIRGEKYYGACCKPVKVKVK